MGEATIPNEIWLEIFKRIDRPTLMELRLVCHHFYDLIEDLLNKSPEWKTLAHEVILYECLEMTMQRAYPYELVTHWSDIHDPVLWRGTYLSYMKWQQVLANPHTIVPLPRFENISCVVTFDKYIAVAFHTGTIACYNIDSISQPFYLANHGTRVLQVEFWYSDGDVLVVSVGNDYALKFWDLQNKTEIATDGFFAKSICAGECRYFCIGIKGGILTSYERVGNQISPGPTLKLPLRNDQQFVSHVADGKYMTALTLDNDGTVQFLIHEVIDGGKLIELELYSPNKDWIRMPKNLYASIQRFTMPTAIFFFGIGKNCIGSTNEYEHKWREYNLSQHFGCNVTSIALHAQILMFGLEDGSIHLLYIPHYGYVRELEQRIKRSKKIEVDTQPIVDLTVLEVDKKPCIVAVTVQRVHLINFF